MHVPLPDAVAAGATANDTEDGGIGVTVQSNSDSNKVLAKETVEIPPYTKVLQHSLMGTPIKRTVTGSSGKEGSGKNKENALLQGSRKSTRLENRPASTLTIEE